MSQSSEPSEQKKKALQLYQKRVREHRTLEAKIRTSMSDKFEILCLNNFFSSKRIKANEQRL